jgi:hypothetical protein
MGVAGSREAVDAARVSHQAVDIARQSTTCRAQNVHAPARTRSTSLGLSATTHNLREMLEDENGEGRIMTIDRRMLSVGLRRADADPSASCTMNAPKRVKASASRKQATGFSTSQGVEVDPEVAGAVAGSIRSYHGITVGGGPENGPLRLQGRRGSLHYVAGIRRLG